MWTQKEIIIATTIRTWNSLNAFGNPAETKTKKVSVSFLQLITSTSLLVF